MFVFPRQDSVEVTTKVIWCEKIPGTLPRLVHPTAFSPSQPEMREVWRTWAKSSYVLRGVLFSWKLQLLEKTNKKKDEFAQLSTLNLRPVFLKMIDGGKESVVLIKDVTLLTFHICFLCSTVASAHTHAHTHTFLKKNDSRMWLFKFHFHSITQLDDAALLASYGLILMTDKVKLKLL